MSTRTFTLTFSAAPQTIELPAGRFFFVKNATDALTIATKGNNGAPVLFENVGAGLKFRGSDTDKWATLAVTSQTNQTVDVVVSDEGEVDIASTVTVAGSVTVTELPSTAIATPAADVVLTASALSIAANAARKRLTIGSLSTNVGSVFIQAAGAGAGRGIELQPGMFVELKTTAAVDVRNDSGASVTVMRFEET